MAMLSKLFFQHSRFGSGKKFRKSGFTLVEVIIIVAVLGVLAVIGFPALVKWVPNYQLKAAAQELYGNLQKAKLHAIKTNRDVTYSFTVSANCSTSSGYVFTDEDGRNVASASYQAGGTCIASSTFTNGSSGFDARGLTIPAASSGTVTLRHARNLSRVHTINQTVAGNIQIQ